MKKSFYKRILYAVSLTLLIVLTLSSSFYISRVRRELEKQLMVELEYASEGFKDAVNTRLQSIVSISNLIMINSDIDSRLNAEYQTPYEHWQFYYYLGKLFDPLTQIEDSINLITLFTTNQTLLPDKKNIRQIQEIVNQEILHTVISGGGKPYFYMMRDVVDESYFWLNNFSSPDNLCMLRLVDYSGQKNILMFEIKSATFLNEYCKEAKKGMYVEDGNGNVIMYYEDGVNLWTHGLSSQMMEINKKENIYLDRVLNNQWKVSLFVNRNEVFSNIYWNTMQLIGITVLIIMGVLAVITLVIKRISTQLIQLNEVIQKAYQIGGQESVDEKESSDEVEQILHSFDHLMQRVEFLMNEVYLKELKNRNMELELLHSQIKPHFLYNTLSSIASLARKHQDQKLMKMITSLSDLYRISLSRGKDIITVDEEIKMTKSYLVIMENRFEDLIEVGFSAHGNALKGLVPKILLQPFVENSINHAMRPDRVLRIVIDIRRIENQLLFQIYDDGLGMDDIRVTELLNGVPDDLDGTNGYGIPNVNRRIKMYMGEAYGVEILSEIGVGTNIKIVMPYVERVEELPLHVRWTDS